MSERSTAGRPAGGAGGGDGDPPDTAYFADHVLRAISDAVLCTDARGTVTFVNPAACTLLRGDAVSLLGYSADELFTLLSAALEPMQHPIIAVLASGVPARVPPGTILVRHDGSEFAIEDCTAPVFDAGGALCGAVMVFHDVTAAHQTMLQMTHQATHDFLTDLPNRALLGSRLAHEVALAARHGTQLAVLYLDLDNFKHVNDSLGHSAGDRLLGSVAARLRECVRRSDTISRFGGDEFVVLLTLTDNAAHMVGIAAGKILAALAAPHEVDGSTLHTSASIGIAVCPQDGTDAESLVRNADTALYLAKGSGKNTFRFYEPHMNEEAVRRQQLQSGLRAALGNGELRVHYQPKFDLRSGRLTGSEALVRWHHPVWGPVPPSRFIPVAEDFGLIGVLGRWVRDTACAQLVAWQQAGMAPGHAAVNVSARELHDPAFEEGLVQTLRETGIAPERLQLEITEGVLLQDTDAALAKLCRVRDSGVGLAIDDFGTGYSSLSYLRRLPVDTIKIDQSFVRAIGADAAGAAIVRAVIGLGQSLGRRIVAEGVEESDQLDFLRRQDCDEAQGYWFSAPLPAAEYASRYG
ncbi:putative bifunctional diguanylate cyclase/phosphodiesterase [Pseudoduganella armeniaca]|uniref:Two-component system response regulator n=1 Tax=Pseudoduganella armeniaca TaxID=2072590 RepID=A0A2R4CBR7_9BURK|nr:GGDEF and EAL domain-containing protein [Pseudoduganella armeniaca]AVR97063.1 two-component system response regulator [Pseudoduganella armeniaca]